MTNSKYELQIMNTGTEYELQNSELRISEYEWQNIIMNNERSVNNEENLITLQGCGSACFCKLYLLSPLDDVG